MPEISCPHCRAILFKTVVVDPKGVTAKTPGGPSIEQDDAGNHFVACDVCGKRVRLEKTTDPAGLAAFKVAAPQA